VKARTDTTRDLLEGHFDVEVFKIERSEDDDETEISLVKPLISHTRQ
jgi:hypothetical protein